MLKTGWYTNPLDQEDGSLSGDQQEPSSDPNTGDSLAGTYDASAGLQSTAGGVEAQGGLPVTLQLNENGTGTANLNGFSGDAQYAGDSVNFFCDNGGRLIFGCMWF